MKNVTVTFTANQIETLLEIIRKDSAEMQAAGIEKRFIETNNRIEERIIKARFEANGAKTYIK